MLTSFLSWDSSFWNSSKDNEWTKVVIICKYTVLQGFWNAYNLPVVQEMFVTPETPPPFFFGKLQWLGLFELLEP